MDDKKKKVREMLSFLTTEHRRLLDEVVKLEEELEKNVSQDILNAILDFINVEIEKHSQLEEVDLDNLLQEAGIDFDIDALNFGHQTLNEIGEHLEYLINLYKEGKKDYRGRDLSKEIIKTFKEYSTTLKDHFLEEENFFFPDILKYDLERFE